MLAKERLIIYKSLSVSMDPDLTISKDLDMASTQNLGLWTNQSSLSLWLLQWGMTMEII